MYINGKFDPDINREKIPILNPATEEVLDDVFRGTAEDAQVAVEAAKQAFPLWSRTPALERAAILHQVAAKMRSHHDELVHLLTLEQGKPIPENEEELW